MTTLQKAIIGATLAAAIGIGIYETRQPSRLRGQVQTLQQQQALLTEQIARLEEERDDASRSLTTLQQENNRLRQDTPELAKLRAEVARLRTDARDPARWSAAAVEMNDPFTQSVQVMMARAVELNRHLEQMPDKKIPELQLLTENDWLSAAKVARFDTDADVRKALGKLRNLAKDRMPMGRALWNFTQEHQGQLPTDISQLKPYFNSALSDAALDDGALDAIFERYKLLHTGKLSDLPPDAWIIAEKAPVDKDYDTLAIFGNGFSTSTRP